MTTQEFENLKSSDVVSDKKFGKKYSVIKKDRILVKDSKEGWVPCVIYQPMYENDFDMFVRPTEDFIEDFVVVRKK